ncbi:MAG: hypothetical protein ABIR71_12440 [Chthoniobacterales bacterium]
MSLAIAAEPVLVFDPSLPANKLPPWLAYLGARSAYRKEHRIPSTTSGEIVSTFAEEVAARMGALGFYSVLREDGKTARDSYWEDLQKVQKANLMKEYVWTYLRHKSWPASQRPANLENFAAWRNAHLNNHKPETHGALAVK